MTAYAVARPTRGIGVRVAFGARPTEVVRVMIRSAVWPAAFGLVAGLAGTTASRPRGLGCYLDSQHRSVDIVVA
jgi:hypothetical protein